ncbi:Mrp/NBP35 family ATP-binding protein [Halanaerobaculum tunisiense]
MYTLKDGEFELEYGNIKEKLIAVASGKGGVGKSTVTANLAVSLAQSGKKVGIIDADIRGFSIPRILGLTEEAKATEDEKLIPAQIHNLKVMSMGTLMPEEKPIVWRGPLLGSTLKQFMTDVNWGELDYLLFDLPPGTGDMPLNILQQIPDANLVVVTTPQVTATKVAGRVGKMAQELEVEISGVVENMSYYQCPDCGNKDYIFGQGGGQKLADKLETQLLGELPLVPEVRESSDQGAPIMIANPESEVSKEFSEIASQISN